ncbi:hypothetical protein [Peribacillus simplex]|uniref:hypothetical protein n=1 Tax=Peribacillus simplex TaxID=1478 RepID=UPI0024C0F54D|nr:hypothetical protein [Peribacillus simplex]WHY56494.1 hypothetical protein QNH43_25940 [Peribacillus simplex]
MDNFIVEFMVTRSCMDDCLGLLMTIKERMRSEGKPFFKNQLVNCDSWRLTCMMGSGNAVSFPSIVRISWLK